MSRRPTIGTFRELPDLQKSYTWNFSTLRQPQFPGGYIDAERLNMRMLSTELPRKENEVATVMIRGHQIFDPGISRVPGTITLTFVETVDAVIRNWIAAWESAVADKPGYFRTLTGDFRITMTDNQDRNNYAYDLLYCFLQSTQLPTLEGGTSDPFQPSITLQYTDLRYVPLGVAATDQPVINQTPRR